jgi:hypothetical protein
MKVHHPMRASGPHLFEGLPPRLEPPYFAASKRSPSVITDENR